MNVEFNEERHEYRINGRIVPSVTQILGDTFPGLYAGIPEHILMRRAQIGTAVHRAIELYLDSKLNVDSLHAEVRPLFESWLKWWRLVEDTAVTLYSERRFGSLLGYAGCDDWFGTIGLEEWEIDWKTTTAPKLTHQIQTAGYHVGIGASPATRRGCLYCQRDGSIAQLIEHKDHKDITDWMAILRVYQLKGALK